MQLSWLKALFIIGAILALHLTPIDEIAFYADGEMFDAAHVIGFAALSYLVTSWLLRRSHAGRTSPLRIYGLAIVIAVAIALVAEGSQIASSRDADFFDFLRDCIGTGGGVLFAASVSTRTRLKPALILLGSTAIVLGLWAPCYSIAAMTAVRLQFPVLATFENQMDLLLATPQRAEIRITRAPQSWNDEGNVLLVTPHPRRGFSGVAFDDHPRDWSDYQTLKFRTSTLASRQGFITVRVNDTNHNGEFTDRFNKQFAIGAAPTTITINLQEVASAPLTRSQDLSSIESLIVFANGVEREGFYIDDLRLE